jgi:Uma2 family endonuclease
MGSCFEMLTLPARIVPSAPLTDDELMAFSRATEPYRIEQNAEGEIIVMTPVGGEGGNLEGRIVRELGNWTEESGHGVYFGPNTGFRLPDSSVLSPDAAWVPIEQWNSLSRPQRQRFLPFCPAFLIELRSPSDPAIELEEKMTRWMSNGAQLAWLIDPIRKLAIVYRPGRQPETLIQPTFLYGEEPVSGFRLEMQRFWA